MVTFRILLVFVVIAFSANAAELTEELLKETMQSNVEAFEKVEIPADGKPFSFELKLGEATAQSGDDFTFDGFRFVMPEAVEGDLIWYFNAARAWSHWYIIPAEGDPKPAFKNWHNADKLYQPQDKAGEEGRFRVLQSLDADYFEAGREYIMWFNQVDGLPESDSTVRVVMAFDTLSEDEDEDEDEDWDHEKIEDALALEPSPPADQVALLKSRGGGILLDRQFFKPGYASSRIDHVFWSIRETVRMQSGFFITMKVSIPPCKTKPHLGDIVEKYGKADFVRDSSELEKKGAKPDDEAETETHYYDYFGFKVAKQDPENRVLQVEAQANNFSVLRPEGESTFGSLSMENLTVFHQKGEEVGRLYFFREGAKDVIVIQEPPVGVYSNGRDELEYLGSGSWESRDYYGSGKLARFIQYKSHQISGKSEGFYESGDPYYVANYKDGRMHGQLVKFDEEGVQTKSEFKEGERVESSPE